MTVLARLAVTLALLGYAGAAGVIAQLAGTPLPFMLGPLIAVALLVCTRAGRIIPDGYGFPQWVRIAFISIIGLMIGAQVTPALFENAPRLMLSLGALTAFVVIALGGNYLLFRRLGGYDRPTAFFSAAPGGLYESIALGEAAGADLPRLMTQQFLRIVFVVSVLPIAVSLHLGQPVGSAAGVSMAHGPVPWSALPWLLLAGIAGWLMGRALRLPAPQLTGPLAVAAALNLAGLVHLDVPTWLVNLAQVVIGTALGMRFAGIGRGMLLKGAALAGVSGAFMLVLAGVFALLLMPHMGEGFDTLLISYAPGGVTEMGLIALSLAANPAFVTMHHILRILLTVVAISALGRRLRA
ncbi:AbrB family transcriptional regulator [Roseovarius aquimarinus]|uniref:AbrB family transcriptional regulator n=1 Tax=Roseovarius aquimarinus TaxID=1229156 RepID=A0ABW7I3G6_9RHOB